MCVDKKSAVAITVPQTPGQRSVTCCSLEPKSGAWKGREEQPQTPRSDLIVSEKGSHYVALDSLDIAMENKLASNSQWSAWLCSGKNFVCLSGYFYHVVSYDLSYQVINRISLQMLKSGRDHWFTLQE